MADEKLLRISIEGEGTQPQVPPGWPADPEAPGVAAIPAGTAALPSQAQRDADTFRVATGDFRQEPSRYEDDPRRGAPGSPSEAPAPTRSQERSDAFREVSVHPPGWSRELITREQYDREIAGRMAVSRRGEEATAEDIDRAYEEIRQERYGRDYGEGGVYPGRRARTVGEEAREPTSQEMAELDARIDATNAEMDAVIEDSRQWIEQQTREDVARAEALRERLGEGPAPELDLTGLEEAFGDPSRQVPAGELFDVEAERRRLEIGQLFEDDPAAAARIVEQQRIADQMRAAMQRGGAGGGGGPPGGGGLPPYIHPLIPPGGLPDGVPPGGGPGGMGPPAPPGGGGPGGGPPPPIPPVPPGGGPPPPVPPGGGGGFLGGLAAGAGRLVAGIGNLAAGILAIPGVGELVAGLAIVTAGLAIFTGVILEATDALNEWFDNLVEEFEPLSGQIATARAMQEVALIQTRQEEGQLIGPTAEGVIEAQTLVLQELIEIRAHILELIAPPLRILLWVAHKILAGIDWLLDHLPAWLGGRGGPPPANFQQEALDWLSGKTDPTFGLGAGARRPLARPPRRNIR